MTTDLPEPPIAADVDLRTFDDMPLDVRALRDSDTAAEVTDEAFRAAVMLWCSAWHQIPAASLPGDDQKLAKLAGYGRDKRGWKRVREQALRGFQLCSDGRLYHLYMCVKAKKAWAKKNEQKQKAKERWEPSKPRKPKKTSDAPASPVADTTAKPQQSHGTSPGNAPAMPLNRGDLSPPIIPPSPPAVSGLDGPAVRPTETPSEREAREALAERKALEVNGSLYRVDPNGYVVLVETSGAVNAMHDLTDDEIEPRDAGDPRLWPVAPEGAALGQKITATPCKPEVTTMAPKDDFDPVRDMPAACRRTDFADVQPQGRNATEQAGRVG